MTPSRASWLAVACISSLILCDVPTQATEAAATNRPPCAGREQQLTSEFAAPLQGMVNTKFEFARIEGITSFKVCKRKCLRKKKCRACAVRNDDGTGTSTCVLLRRSSSQAAANTPQSPTNYTLYDRIIVCPATTATTTSTSTTTARMPRPLVATDMPATQLELVFYFVSMHVVPSRDVLLGKINSILSGFFPHVGRISLSTWTEHTGKAPNVYVYLRGPQDQVNRLKEGVTAQRVKLVVGDQECVAKLPHIPTMHPKSTLPPVATSFSVTTTKTTAATTTTAARAATNARSTTVLTTTSTSTSASASTTTNAAAAMNTTKTAIATANTRTNSTMTITVLCPTRDFVFVSPGKVGEPRLMQVVGVSQDRCIQMCLEMQGCAAYSYKSVAHACLLSPTAAAYSLEDSAKEHQRHNFYDRVFAHGPCTTTTTTTTSIMKTHTTARTTRTTATRSTATNVSTAAAASMMPSATKSTIAPTGMSTTARTISNSLSTSPVATTATTTSSASSSGDSDSGSDSGSGSGNGDDANGGDDNDGHGNGAEDTSTASTITSSFSASSPVIVNTTTTLTTATMATTTAATVATTTTTTTTTTATATATAAAAAAATATSSTSTPTQRAVQVHITPGMVVNAGEPCGGKAKPLNGSFCGRGGTRCNSGYTCDIHPTDVWAVCCPDETAEVTVAECPTAKFVFVSPGKVAEFPNGTRLAQITGLSQTSCVQLCLTTPGCAAYSYKSVAQACLLSSTTAAHSLEDSAKEYRRHNFYNRVFSPGPCKHTAVFGNTEPASPMRTRPNMYVFIADDLLNNEHGLGFTGNLHVNSPVLDGFAANSIQMTRMYTPMAMCTPSRTALYTGLYPIRNGAYTNHQETLASVRTLPMYLQKLSYTVAYGGKMHATPKKLYPFERFLEWPREQELTTLLQDFIDTKRAGAVVANTSVPPWCIFFGSTEPHADHTRDGNHTYHTTFPGASLPKKWPDIPVTREAVAGMYNDINKLDRQFASFVQVLGRNFREDRSITIFTSDHGGKHFAKWSCYDAGLHIPFFVQPNGMEFDMHPRRVDSLLSFVDIVPTLIELAGGNIEDHAGLDGRSFLSLLKNTSGPPVHDYVFGLHTSRGARCLVTPYPIRSVTDGHWKYIRNFNAKATYQANMMNRQAWQTKKSEWGHWLRIEDEEQSKWVKFLECRPVEELYKLADDPHEVNNLAWNPAESSDIQNIPDTLARLRAALAAWMHEQGDTDPVARELDVPLRPSAEEWDSKGCLSLSTDRVCQYPDIISTNEF